LAKRDLSLKVAAAPALCLTIFALPLAALAFGRRLIVFRDAFFFHWPVKLWALDRLRHGVVPFVNFAAGSGEPLLANPNTISLYPTNLLYFLLPAAAAFNLHLLFHVAWAFFGVAVLARRLGVSRKSSWLAGAAFAFSGPYLSYASAFTNSAAAAAWAPWCVAALLRLVRQFRPDRGAGRLRAAVAAGLAFGLQLLAGEPAISIWTALLAGFLAVVIEVPKLGRRFVLRAAGGLALAVVLSSALAAAQLLPTAASIPLSFRGEHQFSRDQFGAGPNVPARLLETVWPLCFGAPGPLVSGAFWGYRIFRSEQPYLFSLNLGLIPVTLVLAALSIATFRRSRQMLALAAAGSLAWLLSYGWSTPLLGLAYAIQPFRHLRYPVKLVVPATLCLAVLAAMAADAWRARTRREGLLLTAGLGAILCLAGIAGATFARQALTRLLAPAFSGMAAGPDAVLPGIFRIVRIDGAAGLAATLLLILWCRRRSASAAVPLAAALCCLLPTGWLLFIDAPAGPLLSKSPLSEALAGGRTFANEMPEFRIAREGSRHAYFADDVSALAETAREEAWPLTGLPSHIRYAFDEDPDGSYGFANRILADAIAAAPPAKMARLLRAASVRYVLSPAVRPLPGFRVNQSFTVSGRTAFVHEVVQPVPEFRAVSCLAGRSSWSGAIELLESPDFDPANCTIVQGPDSNPPAAVANPPRVVAQLLKGNGIAATVDAASPSIAVWSVTFFKYWRATVDGRPAPIVIADGALCGVRLPPGVHRVEIFYDERPFQRGALCASAAFMAAAVLAFQSRRFRRDPESRSGRSSEREAPPGQLPLA
jgi:hypothetical protein